MNGHNIHEQAKGSYILSFLLLMLLYYRKKIQKHDLKLSNSKDTADPEN